MAAEAASGGRPTRPLPRQTAGAWLRRVPGVAFLALAFLPAPFGPLYVAGASRPSRLTGLTGRLAGVEKAVARQQRRASPRQAVAVDGLSGAWLKAPRSRLEHQARTYPRQADRNDGNSSGLSRSLAEVDQAQQALQKKTAYEELAIEAVAHESPKANETTEPLSPASAKVSALEEEGGQEEDPERDEDTVEEEGAVGVVEDEVVAEAEETKKMITLRQSPLEFMLHNLMYNERFAAEEIETLHRPWLSWFLTAMIWGAMAFIIYRLNHRVGEAHIGIGTVLCACCCCPVGLLALIMPVDERPRKKKKAQIDANAPKGNEEGDLFEQAAEADNSTVEPGRQAAPSEERQVHAEAVPSEERQVHAEAALSEKQQVHAEVAKTNAADGADGAHDPSRDAY